MKLLFKQRFFSWFDSYDIYDEREEACSRWRASSAGGHVLHVLDAGGRHVGTVREKGADAVRAEVRDIHRCR